MRVLMVFLVLAAACSDDADGGTWAGDFLAAHWEDPAAVDELLRASVVSGTLELPITAELPELRAVGGSVRLLPGVVSIGLPALATVGGDLVLDGAGSVETAALVRVGGDLVIRGEYSLAIEECDALATLAGSGTSSSPVTAR
jgi:hypothetical protein